MPIMNLKICRICLQNNGTIPLFDNFKGTELSKKIMLCVNVTIAEDDGLPNTICSICTSELSITYDFVIKCQESDKTLQSYLGLVNSLENKQDIEVKKEDIREDDLSTEEYVEDSFLNGELLLKPDSIKCKIELEDNTIKVKRKRKNASRNDIPLINCSDCDLTLPSVAALKIHMRSHTGEKPYQCHTCGKQFSRKANLIRHFKRHDMTGKLQRKYSRRLKRPKMGPLQCTLCGLLVNCSSAMTIHLRTHTGEKPFACPLCDKRYAAKGCLKRHIQTNHTTIRERKFTCETCGTGFYNKSDIIVHMRRHTGEKPHLCPFCDRRFLQISSLIRHKRTHTGDKPYSCDICGRQFADKSLIKKHMSVHSNERNFKCHLCEKSMKTQTSLSLHLKLHTNEKHYVCSFCGLSFSMKGNLKTHVSRLHSEKSGQCTVCSKTFSDIDMHMRKHTGEKPFICLYCNRAFASKVSLTTHVTFKHKNSDKYKCSIGDCSKTFPIPSMLEFHLLKQHTNHTPHICQHCSRGFFRASDLSRHLRVSHMDIPVKLN